MKLLIILVTLVISGCQNSNMQHIGSDKVTLMQDMKGNIYTVRYYMVGNIYTIKPLPKEVNVNFSCTK